jgi:bifunctional DNA-binding transcriptional regulator/antitoxin component of YhaV-PrlF toxin-antitoxin module
VKASQLTGHPVPPFKLSRRGRKELKHVELVEVKRRGKGSAFGVNVPQEPLSRAGLKPGDKLKVSVRGKTISLTREKTA